MTDLISLLESESKQQQKHPKKPFTKINSKDVDLQIVYDVFLETEKLIRVIANTVQDQSSHQAINQLRYAGHHILKHSLDSTNKDNLIEAYKHCVRAHYDILDYYVLKLGHFFKNRLLLIENSDKKEMLRTSIDKSLKRIQQSRFDSQNRSDYYQQIHQFLIEDLRLIDEINSLSSQYGESILQDKNVLIMENNKLKDNLDRKLEERSDKMDKHNIRLAAVIAVATMLGLLFQGACTGSFHSPVLNVEHSLNAVQFPTHPIGKK